MIILHNQFITCYALTTSFPVSCFSQVPLLSGREEWEEETLGTRMMLRQDQVLQPMKTLNTNEYMKDHI